VDKQAILASIREAVGRELSILTRSAESAREGATHEDAKPENDKDTRAVEAGYLAGAQANRVLELGRLLRQLELFEPRTFSDRDPIAISALVEADVDGVRTRYFLAPAGGGAKPSIGGVEVQVITPESPVGRALVGRRAGDSSELVVGRARREIEIVAVE
jgi:transcription elongation GreA/GreB family factor